LGRLIKVAEINKGMISTIDLKNLYYPYTGKDLKTVSKFAGNLLSKMVKDVNDLERELRGGISWNIVPNIYLEVYKNEVAIVIEGVVGVDIKSLLSQGIPSTEELEEELQWGEIEDILKDLKYNVETR
jgi:hypothetical protein